MPNQLSATGLVVASTDEISTDLTTAYQVIYGDDINTAPESPDGQQIAIYAQMDSDNLDLLVDIYNIFSVASAYGVALQRLVEVNGIAIKNGTYTTTVVQVTTNAAGNLPGLDQTVVAPYQISDPNNTWTLLFSYTFAGAATQALIFQATTLGTITPIPNTITQQVTPLNFVTSVNNPAFSVTTNGVVTSGSPIVTGIASTTGMTPGMSLTDAGNFFQTGTVILSVNSSSQITASSNATGGAPTTEPITVATPGTVLGLPFETDLALRTRQAQSFSLAATGPADAVEGQLLNLPDVIDAVVSENKGTMIGPFPINSLWCVVVGGTPAEIANVIYKKCSCNGLYGAQTYTIVRPNGQPSTINYDIGLPQALYMKFSIIPRTPGQTFNNTLLIQQLAAALVQPYFRLGRSASVGDIVTPMNAINPQVIVVTPGVSLDGVTYVTTAVAPSSAKYWFNVPAANIQIV